MSPGERRKGKVERGLEKGRSWKVWRDVETPKSPPRAPPPDNPPPLSTPTTLNVKLKAPRIKTTLPEPENRPGMSDDRKRGDKEGVRKIRKGGLVQLKIDAFLSKEHPQEEYPPHITSMFRNKVQSIIKTKTAKK